MKALLAFLEVCIYLAVEAYALVGGFNVYPTFSPLRIEFSLP